MENATHALLIATGILFGLIVITMLVYVFSNASEFWKDEQKESEVIKISDWNAEWEAYDKQVMYGADIITVMKKAIQNNYEWDVLDEHDNSNYINIILKTKDDFKTSVIETDIESHTKTDVTDEIDSIDCLAGVVASGELKGGKIYQLGKWEGDDLKLQEEITLLFENDKVFNDFVIEDEEGKKEYYVYSAFTSFKVSTFKCTGVKKNEDGRIMEMSFEQI